PLRSRHGPEQATLRRVARVGGDPGGRVHRRDHAICRGSAHGRDAPAAPQGRGRGQCRAAIRGNRIGESRIRPERAGVRDSGRAERRGREGPVHHQRRPVRGRVDDPDQDGFRGEGGSLDESATIRKADRGGALNAEGDLMAATSTRTGTDWLADALLDLAPGQRVYATGIPWAVYTRLADLRDEKRPGVKITFDRG